MIYTTTIQFEGKQHSVRIPKDIVMELGIEKGDNILINVEEELRQITISLPLRKQNPPYFLKEISRNLNDNEKKIVDFLLVYKRYITVGKMSKELNRHPYTIRRSLNFLNKKGMIIFREEGNRIYYKLK